MECPNEIGSSLIVNPFINFYAFFKHSSLLKLIQQYREKCNFLEGYDRVMFWKPSSLPTISKISNLDIFLGIALINMVLASGSNPKKGGPFRFIFALTFISTVWKFIGIDVVVLPPDIYLNYYCSSSL